ncbi:restriction endonuclease subunit S [Rhodococcus sp. PAE-6]|uniref:restriction endonuclease subunit S n=1 Tax=unclassified Rhodococcus (in: high G+C Gram-positive bacteria) TaxID=192944 RepID=UPI000A00426D|nr:MULTISPECIES: restriction endonuclease subunit S [unclassified Rhodococcus (in: high G+C Gram-positive bacteria)]MCT7294087.1 restriction endonuclease subunit S [Rhodococcus sp. PAE-6]
MTVVAEWKETTIGSVASVSRGASPRPIASARWFDSGSDVRWVRIADVNRSDGRTLLQTTQALSSDGIARSRYLARGTLIMSIAATVGVPVITGIPTCIHDGFVALENLKVDQKFLLYLLKASEGKLREAGQSGSQMNVNTDIVKGLNIRIPINQGEQKRIAAALWDIDDLIATLERLIVKKQAIKQGMMQQLLTGRTRLPGFVGAWKLRQVSDLVDGLAAGVSVRSTTATTGRGSILKTSCVENGKFIPSESKPILPADIPRARCNPLGGSLVISRMNTPALVGQVGYVRETRLELFLPDRLWMARAKRGTVTDMRWLTYHFASDSGASCLRGMATGTSGSMKNIPKDRFLSLEIEVPSEREQVAIANALQDADDEIDLLEARLAKARAVKTGMMQQLLTGRTRLLAEPAA